MAHDATEAEVLAYLGEQHPGLYDLAAWTRQAVIRADPDLTERIYPGWQGIGFRHPEAGFVAAIYPRSEYVVLLLEHGAALPDPDGVLLGDGRRTRFLRVAEAGRDVEERIVAVIQ